VTTTTTPVTGVPIELCNAYEADPTCWQILGVMADAAEENGESLAADCLRWCYEKRRVPLLYGDRYDDYGGAGWNRLWDENQRIIFHERLVHCGLPAGVSEAFDTVNPNKWAEYRKRRRQAIFVVLLQRLIDCWHLVDREEAWKWSIEQEMEAAR
jgi:hypothetical protein